MASIFRSPRIGPDRLPRVTRTLERPNANGQKTSDRHFSPVTIVSSRDMDPYQIFVELYARSANDDHAASGSGDLSVSDGHGHDAGEHVHADLDHHGYAHPGTVLFLFVAIAVGGKNNY